MSGVNFDPKRVIRTGDKRACDLFIKTSYRDVQKAIEECRLSSLEIHNYFRQLGNGGSIRVFKRLDAILKVVIFIPEGKVEEPADCLMQCDMYSDDPEFPDDLTKQIKTPIWFSLPDGATGFLTEREGNVHWTNDVDLVSWDCTPNWGTSITSKRAWNDAIISSTTDSGLPSYTPPEHVTRKGELGERVFNYPSVRNTGSEEHWLIHGLNHRGVRENDSEPEQYFFGKSVWINGIKYTINYEFSNQYVIGACLHRFAVDLVYCVLITTLERSFAGEYGLDMAYEQVHYFKVTDDINPTPIFILKMDQSNPVDTIYPTCKQHITPWTFNLDGTKGKAFRSEQYAVSDLLDTDLMLTLDLLI